MKSRIKSYLLLFVVAAFLSCSPDNDKINTDAETAQTLLNVHYGSDAEQVMDIYLPANRSAETTKVIVLVHGGGWVSGSKDDLASSVTGFQATYPDHAIVNINYRLATAGSPGYPKQINDIEKVIAHLENNNYHISEQYAFVGASAGAHLSMLYAYKFDPQHHVKVVTSIVGPTDFTDPAYQNNELFAQALVNLTGPNPSDALIDEVSPTNQVTAQSPPTIQFLGNQDPLIPVSQGTRLETALNAADVINELHYYNAGHGDFSQADLLLIYQEMTAFYADHF